MRSPRFLLLAAILLVVACGAHAQPPASLDNPATHRTFLVITVVDSVTLQPLKNVTIRVGWYGEQRTGEDGRAEIFVSQGYRQYIAMRKPAYEAKSVAIEGRVLPWDRVPIIRETVPLARLYDPGLDRKPPPHSQSAWWVGRVFDATTGEPIDDVSEYRGDHVRKHFSRHSWILLRDDVPATHDITLVVNGYRPRDVTCRTELLGDADTFPVERIEMEPITGVEKWSGGSLVVTVRGWPSRNGIPDARITLAGIDRNTRDVSAIKHSDDEGNVRFEGLKAGDYHLYVDAEGWTNKADTVTVKPAEGSLLPRKIEQGILLLPQWQDRLAQPGGRIFGRVTDALTGEPLQGVKVRLSHAAEAYTDQDGFYLIRQVEAGAYELAFHRDGYREEGGVSVRIHPDNPRNLTELEVDMRLDATTKPQGGNGVVEGTVTWAETGRPAVGNVVVADGGGRDTCDIHGRFSIGSLSPGSYRVRLTENDWNTMETVQIRELPGAADTVTLRRTVPVQVSMGGPGQLLTGMVTEGRRKEPVPGATLTLLPDLLTVTSDSLGGFALYLTAGRRTLVAEKEGYLLWREEFDIPQRFHEDSPGFERTIRLERAGGRERKGTGHMAGRVLDAVNRQPVRMATVSLEGTRHAFSVDSAGRFAFNEVPRGIYWIEVTALGMESIRVPVDLAEDRDDLAIELIPLRLTLDEPRWFYGAGREEREPMELVHGQVTSALSGDPLARVLLEFASTDVPGDTLACLTSPEGAFGLQLPRGGYRLTASRAMLATKTKDISVGRHPDPLDFSMELAPARIPIELARVNGPKHTLQVTVRDLFTREPVQGATVREGFLELTDAIPGGHLEHPASIETDSAGRAEITGFPSPWHAWIGASAPGYHSFNTPLGVAVIQAGAPLEILLAPDTPEADPWLIRTDLTELPNGWGVGGFIVNYAADIRFPAGSKGTPGHPQWTRGLAPGISLVADDASGHGVRWGYATTMNTLTSVSASFLIQREDGHERWMLFHVMPNGKVNLMGSSTLDQWLKRQEADRTVTQ